MSSDKVTQSSPDRSTDSSESRALWKTVINSLVKYAPAPVQRWITDLKVRRFLATDRIPVVYEPHQLEKLQQRQREALLLLMEKLSAKSLGDYLEFGVFSGTSLGSMFAVTKELGLSQMRLFGFDSFEGMPDVASTEDEGTWQPGQFKFDIEYTKGILTQRGVDWQRTFLTKGWFCDTLTPDLIQQYRIEKASVIMVDCDLYSSTRDVLRFCAPLIKDQAVIFFDDWNSNQLAEKELGEKKAFKEFLAENPQFVAEEIAGYTEASTAFVVSRQS